MNRKRALEIAEAIIDAGDESQFQVNLYCSSKEVSIEIEMEGMSEADAKPIFDLLATIPDYTYKISTDSKLCLIKAATPTTTDKKCPTCGVELDEAT